MAYTDEFGTVESVGNKIPMFQLNAPLMQQRTDTLYEVLDQAMVTERERVSNLAAMMTPTNVSGTTIGDQFQPLINQTTQKYVTDLGKYAAENKDYMYDPIKKMEFDKKQAKLQNNGVIGEYNMLTSEYAKITEQLDPMKDLGQIQYEKSVLAMSLQSLDNYDAVKEEYKDPNTQEVIKMTPEEFLSSDKYSGYRFQGSTMSFGESISGANKDFVGMFTVSQDMYGNDILPGTATLEQMSQAGFKITTANNDALGLTFDYINNAGTLYIKDENGELMMNPFYDTKAHSMNMAWNKAWQVQQANPNNFFATQKDFITAMMRNQKDITIAKEKQWSFDGSGSGGSYTGPSFQQNFGFLNEAMPSSAGIYSMQSQSLGKGYGYFSGITEGSYLSGTILNESYTVEAGQSSRNGKTATVYSFDKSGMSRIPLEVQKTLQLEQCDEIYRDQALGHETPMLVYTASFTTNNIDPTLETTLLNEGFVKRQVSGDVLGGKTMYTKKLAKEFHPNKWIERQYDEEHANYDVIRDNAGYYTQNDNNVHINTQWTSQKSSTNQRNPALPGSINSGNTNNQGQQGQQGNKPWQPPGGYGVKKKP
ncbi:MAG: hypothetical protein RLY43_1366 [Bacteroidota bacterium]